jgi:RNA polymerase sigma-70 factor (ECF subfamily)
VVKALTATLGDADLAVEAAQEAMARAWRDWATVGRAHNPSGWVYRVALNWSRSRFRRLRREVLGGSRDKAHLDAEPMDPSLTVALRGLSADHRAVLALRYCMDWSIEDIAAALEVPVGTVKSRQHWALQRLREVLGDDT